MIGKPIFPGNCIEVRLHLPCSMAGALATARTFLNEYEPPYLSDQAIKDLAGKIRLIKRLEQPSDSEPYHSVITTDGRHRAMSPLPAVPVKVGNIN
ncbi:MAG: hypothetical protein ACWGOX_11845 [Desulforhopalus sp.]